MRLSVLSLVILGALTGFVEAAYAQSGPPGPPKPAVDVTQAMLDIAAKIGEIYYVVSGRGTQVTGALTNGTKQTGSTTIGPGWSSTTPIANGRTTTLGPGEMQIIPPGTGHVWTEIADGGMVYMVIRIDPERVLALSK